MTRLTNPTPLFLDARGALLDAGYVYVGAANADPASQPIATYWDAAMKVPAAQPLRTLGGVIVNGATPAQVFFAEADYALRIEDADGQLIEYQPTSFPVSASYQPLDADLTAIAEQGVADYGRSLLLLSSKKDLRDATGIPDPLPAIGGVLTGNVTRQGAGGLAYGGSSMYLTIRIFGPEYTTDPTTQPGDIWFKANG